MATRRHGRPPRRGQHLAGSRPGRGARGVRGDSLGFARGHIVLAVAAGLAVATLSVAAIVSMVEPRPGAVALGGTRDGDLPALGDKRSARGDGGGELELDLVQQRRVLAVLAQAGLDAESLAACGVTAQEATGVAAAVVEELETLVGGVESAGERVLDLEQQTDALERLVIAGQATQPQSAALATARGNLAAALAARESALDSVREAAMGELSIDQVARLTHLRTTRDHHLPASLKALDCTGPEFCALENAYTSVRVAGQLELAPDPAAQAIVSDAQAQPAATAASAWLGSNLAAVTSSLAAAAGAQ